MPLTMVFDPAGDLLDATRACEADVFLDTYGNTRQQWHEEYGPYEAASIFTALAEPGGDVVAACRMILPNEAGLKTLDDVARPPWSINGYDSARSVGIDVSAAIDVATIAVRKGLRGAGKLASMALYHGVMRVTQMNGLPNIVMIMDERARRLLTSTGCDTFSLPGTRPGSYLGSPVSIPVWTHVPRMIENQRRFSPDAYRLVSLGVGFDGIDVPPASSFTLRPRVPAGVGAVLERT